MILADYPGNLLAALLLVGAAALIFLAYSSKIVRPARWWRLLLGFLQYAAVAAILLLIWNPSLPTSSEKSTRNSVLVVFDTSESMSVTDGADSARLDRALKLFKDAINPSDPDGPLYSVYGFDANCYTSASPDLLRRWGARTNMHSVATLLDRYDLLGETAESAPGIAKDSKVVGVVCFTDGQADDKNAQAYFPLKGGRLKVLFVGVGSDKVPTDLAVTAIRAPARIAIDTPYNVQVDVAAKGVKNEKVTVALFEDDALADARTLDLKEGAEKATLQFALAARVLGRHRLTARARMAGAEPNEANNVREAVLQVVEPPRLKVLYYAQVASFDFGKVRSSLERDKKIDLDIGLDAVVNPDMSQKARAASGSIPLPKDKEGFYAYDVIILGPCNFSKFTAPQIDGLYSLVSERGGGVIFLSGRGEFDCANSANEKIRALLPAEYAAAKKSSVADPRPLVITPEGVDARILSPADLKDFPVDVLPFHGDTVKKPASAVLAAAGGDPIFLVQRVGRGRVCYVNTYGLFRWYREDLDGGLLRKAISSLTANVGRITSREASIELFASRSAEDPFRIAFDAQVFDDKWAPVEGATVLLDVAGETIRMEETSAGRYGAEINGVHDEAILAHAQAEKAGVFIGEKTLTASLPCPRMEMDHTELDRKFLQDLANRVGGQYLDAEHVDSSTAGMFPPTSKSFEGGLESAWRTWPLLAALCVLLSTLWFTRRAIGLI